MIFEKKNKKILHNSKKMPFFAPVKCSLQMISRRLLRIKVLQVYYSSLLKKNRDLEIAIKELNTSVQHTLDLYYELLSILIYISDLAEQKIQTALEKRLPTEADLNPNKRFANNPVFEIIRNSEHYQKNTSAPRIPADAHQQLVKQIWSELTASNEYQKYMLKTNVSMQDHKDIIIYIIRNFFPCNDELDSLIEEYSIYWNDDIGFVSSLLEKSIIRIKRSGNDSFLITNAYTCDADKIFGKELLGKALIHDNEYEDLIDKHSKNWDVDRIAIIDRIIMKLAITEFIHLPEVPIKVTINEYIEISKFYSTEKSNAFINGMLDQMVSSLKEEEKINKKGRGLVDNIA